MRTIIVLCSLFFLMLSCNLQDGTDKSALSGSYLGQKLPGNEPELFAPGIISTGLYTRDVAMTPDGQEFYYCVAVGGYSYATILHTRLIDNRWTEPEVVPHMDNPNVINFEPCISPDGRKLYFLSNRADTLSGDKEAGDQDIWVMERTGNGWSEPYNLGTPVNSDAEEYFPSVTLNGTIYFTRNEKGSRMSYIYRSRYIDGHYQEPEKLGPEINSGRTQYNAFIAPDESYIIVPTVGREDSFGGTDYYISFRNEDDRWIGPVNMGEKINTKRGAEFSPYVSPDGKYFFFMAVRTPDEEDASPEGKLTYKKLQAYHNSPQRGSSDIYWVSTEFFAELKRKAEAQAGPLN
jgi:hypothetical protein